MRKKQQPIPVNLMANEFGSGMSISTLAVKDLPAAGMEEAKRSHREDGHSFFLLQNGTISVEIDFQIYHLTPPSIVYIHPNQVHRILAFENVIVSSLSIINEHLNPEYLQLLEEITPAKPLALSTDIFGLIAEAVLLTIKFAERKPDKLHHSLLKDICNALVALIASLYLEQAKQTAKLSRFDMVTKAFRESLERNYTIAKRPAAYAQKLHLSTPYLNECVKSTTGYSVSHHIQQRVILEAKRLLSHSNQSVKEIAAGLGYDDYPYFSRLFTKVTGISALAFRKKNLG